MSLPAAKHFDPVLGLDVHMIQPPVGPPLPIPHPFVGIVFDALDYVPATGSTVFVNGLPAAKAGTLAHAMPAHVPIGGTFVPPVPGNEGQMFMGSRTVSTEGEPATYGLLRVLTCQSFGAKAPGRRKARRMLSPLLPTSMVFPIPAGAPVTIGGAPTISLDGMASGFAISAALKGLGIGLNRLAKMKAMRRMVRAMSDQMLAASARVMNQAWGATRIESAASRVARFRGA